MWKYESRYKVATNKIYYPGKNQNYYFLTAYIYIIIIVYQTRLQTL